MQVGDRVEPQSRTAFKSSNNNSNEPAPPSTPDMTGLPQHVRTVRPHLRQVIVTHVHHPGDFYIQTVDVDSERNSAVDV